MSIKVMSAVWDESQHSGSALNILLALADHASDDGVCWPSMDRIARCARLSVRQAQQIIEKLIASGELHVQHNAGRNHVNLYLVTIRQDEKSLYKVLCQRFEMPPEEARQTTYDILQRRDAEKVQSAAPFEEKVQPTSPLESEKVNSSAEKVQPGAEKVKSSALKGEAGCTQTVINRQLTVSEPEETPDDETARALWDRAANELRRELPGPLFERFRDVTATCSAPGTFELQCRSPLDAEVFQTRLNARIVRALTRITGRPVEIRFTGPAPGLVQ